ncbi:MAG TPA: ABC transporter permease, partial [Syntrophomonas sp.]|nr:ABC transporter permease [Syntrophomonas sp.]
DIIGPLSAFVIIFLIASVTTPRFFDAGNIHNLILQVCVTAFLAIGATLVILTGGIDISSGSAIALQTMVLATMVKFMNVPVWQAIILVIILATIMGLYNGALVAYLRIPAFIATLASQAIFRGIAFLFNNGSPLQSISPEVEPIFYTKIGFVPITFFYIFVFYTAAFTLLKYTQLGRKIYAVGGNESAARLSGINVKSVLLVTYAMAGFFTGIAAVLMACRLNSGSQNYGPGMEMTAIAAAVIGGTSMIGGKGNVVSTFIGAMIVLIVQNVLNLNSVPTSVQQVVLGIIIMLAVVLDVWRSQLSKIFIKTSKAESKR